MKVRKCVESSVALLRSDGFEFIDIISPSTGTQRLSDSDIAMTCRVQRFVLSISVCWKSRSGNMRTEKHVKDEHEQTVNVHTPGPDD